MTPLQILEAVIAEPAIGSVTALARSLTALTPDAPCTPQAISQWRRGLIDETGSIPVNRCEPIETLTCGKYRVEDMRPDVQWNRNTDGQVVGFAPPVRAITPTQRRRKARVVRA